MNKALALILLAACGDDGATVVDAAIDTTQADSMVDMSPAVKEGQVFIAEAHSPIDISTAYAMLLDGPLEMPTAMVDGCITMPLTSASSLGAGTITITGTAIDLTLTQDETGDVYTAGSTPADLMTPGATLTVSATGATVPAFTGTVTAPELFDTTFPMSLSRSNPVTLTWTAGSATAAWFLFTAESGAMLCRGPDSGSFTVTQAAFALMPASADTAMITGYRVTETTTTAGARTVYIRAADGQSSGPLDFGQ
jgi:hypothetical protein